MATFKEKTGWDWSVDERQSRQAALRRMRSVWSNLHEQTRRTALYLPEYQARAEDALWYVKEGLLPVVDIDLSRRGRKYLPLSPEEFDCIFESLPELIQPWENLVTSPEYAMAVRRVNRGIRAQNRMVNARNAELSRQISEFERLANQGDVAAAFGFAARKGLL